MAWTVKPSATTVIEQRDQPYLTPKMKQRYTAELLPRYEKAMGALVPILNDVQHRYRCVPYQAMVEIARFLQITPADVLDTASFYEEYTTEPTGRHVIAVCQSIACEICGHQAILDHLRRKLDIERIGMDRITIEAERNRNARLVEAAQARELVDDALLRLHDRFADRLYGPLFGALQRRYRHTAQEGVKRLLKKELKGLGPAEREAIEAWCEVLARRFAHIPCLGLRGLLYNGPDGSLDAFLDGLDPEFADELRQALEQTSAPQRAAGA